MLARSITYGVHALSLGTQKVREGDFDYTIQVRSRDQLGELAGSFNHMARGLKQLMRGAGRRRSGSRRSCASRARSR